MEIITKLILTYLAVHRYLEHQPRQASKHQSKSPQTTLLSKAENNREAQQETNYGSWQKIYITTCRSNAYLSP